MATKFRSLDDLPLVLRVDDLIPILDIAVSLPARSGKVTPLFNALRPF